MIRALALLLLATAAHADKVDLSGSTVTLQPTDHPGAMAEVVFDNRYVNNGRDNGEYSASLDGLAVPFRFTWNTNGDDDEITVMPPQGITCLPTSCVLQVPEYQAGTLWLFSVEGVGM